MSGMNRPRIDIHQLAASNANKIADNGNVTYATANSERVITSDGEAWSGYLRKKFPVINGPDIPVSENAATVAAIDKRARFMNDKPHTLAKAFHKAQRTSAPTTIGSST